MIIFPQPLGWSLLLAMPAFAVLVLNGAWIAVLSGIVATRFRDIPPIIASLTQLLFFMTPIVWQYDTLLRNPAVGRAGPDRRDQPGAALRGDPAPAAARAADPRPALGGGRGDHRRRLPAALVCLRNYRSRVAYWV